MHLPTGQQVVILKEKTNDRYLPIWIGMFEAKAIAMKIHGMAATHQPPRLDLYQHNML